MKEAMFLCYSVTCIKRSVSSKINGMPKEVGKIVKVTRISVARASSTQVHAFLKFFSKILNLHVLSDKEMLKTCRGMRNLVYFIMLILSPFTLTTLLEI